MLNFYSEPASAMVDPGAKKPQSDCRRTPGSGNSGMQRPASGSAQPASGQPAAPHTAPPQAQVQAQVPAAAPTAAYDNRRHPAAEAPRSQQPAQHGGRVPPSVMEHYARHQAVSSETTEPRRSTHVRREMHAPRSHNGLSLPGH